MSSCTKGEVEAVLSCGAKSSDYDDWITYSQVAVDAWATYTRDGKTTLTSYGIDYTNGLTGIGFCVQGCYSLLARGRSKVTATQQFFDVHAQCDIAKSHPNARQTQDISRNFQNGLYGVDVGTNNSVTSINDCIIRCVNLARAGKILLDAPTAYPTRNPTTAKPTTAKPTTAKPTTHSPTTTLPPTPELSVSCGHSVTATMGSDKKSRVVKFTITKKQTWLSFDMCGSSFNTQFVLNVGGKSYTAKDSLYCAGRTDLPYVKLTLAAKSLGVGSTGTVTVSWQGGTPGSWTLRMQCSANRRRLLSGEEEEEEESDDDDNNDNEEHRRSLMLGSPITGITASISVINNNNNNYCKPANWQKDTAQPGFAQGDPHITRFDVSQYSFQGQGAFLLYKLDNFEIHGLFIRRPVDVLKAIFTGPLTYVMGFAVIVNGNISVGWEAISVYANSKSEGASISGYFKCTSLSSTVNRWYFGSRFRYQFTASNSIRMEFFNGIALTYTTNNWNLMVYVPQFLQGMSFPKTILGGYGGVPINPPTLSRPPCPFSLFNSGCKQSNFDKLVLPKAFCECNRPWVFDEGPLLCGTIHRRLLLQDGMSTTEISNVTYNSTETFNLTNFNSTEQAWITSICGSDLMCAFDLASTGDESLAQQTKQGNLDFNKTLDTIANSFECYPPCANNGTCIADNQCSCVGEFTGSRCDKDGSLPEYSIMALASFLTGL
ncbi:hypothetical protein RFI_01721 [Reticulomyxa filosa]|uniref:EGF-like domain-containing protein n=1 Tax=Reticulomyxa filosa TaxID=46433 RepID=X6PCF2_RETFI|nr:hypothetical protein RFI_01721 [Reticulomyxa filosa]|eukprot:ETO35342.1 hypothetical protein RFI_01721 [Reticulomyxa filosa]